MRTLMLGWEFPPHISGGLGTACLGLTRAMTSGAAEVLHKGAETVDFWAITTMADKILALLQTPERVQTLCRNAREETRRLTWDVAARKCLAIYDRLSATLQTV